MSLGAHGRESKISIKPPHVDYGIMGRFRKYCGSIKIQWFILIFILIILFYIV